MCPFQVPETHRKPAERGLHRCALRDLPAAKKSTLTRSNRRPFPPWILRAIFKTASATNAKNARLRSWHLFTLTRSGLDSQRARLSTYPRAKERPLKGAHWRVGMWANPSETRDPGRSSFPTARFPPVSPNRRHSTGPVLPSDSHTHTNQARRSQPRNFRFGGYMLRNLGFAGYSVRLVTSRPGL